MGPWLSLLLTACAGHPEASAGGEPARARALPPPVAVEAAGPGLADPSALIFDGPFPEFAVDISPDGMQALRDAPTEWVPAGFTWKGVRYFPVGVRVKGQGSFQPIDDKPSLKIKFTEYADFDFLGLERITLNNMTNDTSMLHEQVAYWMYRQAGVPAARASHARLTLNGEAYGLYDLLEDVDETWAKRWFGEPVGAMWEMDEADFEPAWVAAFEHEFGIDDRTAFVAVSDGIVLGGDDGYAQVATGMDIDATLREFAMCGFIGQFDAYPYRYLGDDTHWYGAASDGRLQAVPHGVDETFNPYSDMGAPSGAFPWFCAARADCWEQWRSEIWDVYDLSVEVGLLDYAVAVRDQVTPYAYLDTNKSYSNDDVLAGQEAMILFIQNREADILAQIGPRP